MILKLINICYICALYFYFLSCSDVYLFYVQAYGTMLGICTNTIEKGTTVIGSFIFTIAGFNGGIPLEESTVKTFQFKSTFLLLKSLFGAVRWYSSLVLIIGIFSNLDFRANGPLFSTETLPFSVVMLTSNVTSASMLINNNVIPC